jgi:phosphohistidine phosphatase
MQLILVRHAEAEAESSGTMGDFGRALTVRGREQAVDAGNYLRRQIPNGTQPHVWTSPFIRAVQTAEDLAARLSEVTVSVAEALGSGKPVDLQVSMVAALDSDQDAILVGHEPLMSELAADLLGIPVLPFAFDKGGCMILRKRKRKKGFAFVSYRAPFGKEREKL